MNVKQILAKRKKKHTFDWQAPSTLEKEVKQVFMRRFKARPNSVSDKILREVCGGAYEMLELERPILIEDLIEAISCTDMYDCFNIGEVYPSEEEFYEHRNILVKYFDDIANENLAPNSYGLIIIENSLN